MDLVNFLHNNHCFCLSRLFSLTHFPSPFDPPFCCNSHVRLVTRKSSWAHYCPNVKVVTDCDQSLWMICPWFFSPSASPSTNTNAHLQVFPSFHPLFSLLSCQHPSASHLSAFQLRLYDLFSSLPSLLASTPRFTPSFQHFIHRYICIYLLEPSFTSSHPLLSFSSRTMEVRRLRGEAFFFAASWHRNSSLNIHFLHGTRRCWQHKFPVDLSWSESMQTSSEPAGNQTWKMLSLNKGVITLSAVKSLQVLPL